MIETCRPSLEDIKGDQDWSTAETRLIKMCGVGQVARFDTARPTAASDENTIRAGLIRHIMLGGCEGVPVHAKGVQIQGAWITGVLDLQACDSPLDLYLSGCHICQQPNLGDARLGSVMLPGCAVPGLNAHRLKVERSVLLNQGFKAQGTVDLSSAEIGGTVDCSGGTFGGAGRAVLR